MPRHLLKEVFYASFDGTKIYYEIKGEGYPIVMLHGFTGTSQGWKKRCTL
jgi:pimeloyl-ACP methyl ester carboxylesterase